MDESTVGKVADAGAEIAKTAKAALDLTGRFGSFFREPLKEAVAILHNEIKFIRATRELSLASKWQKLMAFRGLREPTRRLPPNFAIPLLVTALLEEDDELQETWARLLVNAGDAANPMELRVAYVEILKGMSAFDVRNLSLMAKASLEAKEKSYLPVVETWYLPTSAKVHEENSEVTGTISNGVGISLANLNRLGCAAPAYGFGGMAIFSLMTVTHLGRALYLACT